MMTTITIIQVLAVVMVKAMTVVGVILGEALVMMEEQEEIFKE